MSFKLEIKEQNKEFDIEIGNKVQEFDYLVIYEMKLNGHNGRCLIIKEDFNENINYFSNYEIEVKTPTDLVIPISDTRAKNVEISGGKGASLAILTQISNTTFRNIPQLKWFNKHFKNGFKLNSYSKLKQLRNLKRIEQKV